MFSLAVPSFVMAKKRREGTSGQANFKFDPALLKRVRAFGNRHPMKPSMTRLFALAMVRYLEEEEPKLPK
jgi:hypothetical protein